MTLCNENAPILVNEEMGCNIWLMTVRAPEIATTARPGQFVHCLLYTSDAAAD